MKGMIAFWAYSVARIPAGWHLCDGEEGTPDLLNHFFVCAGDTYAVDDQGGNSPHVHNFSAFAHAHVQDPVFNLYYGLAFVQGTAAATDTGTTDPEANLPPYRALVPIMKL